MSEVRVEPFTTWERAQKWIAGRAYALIAAWCSYLIVARASGWARCERSSQRANVFKQLPTRSYMPIYMQMNARRPRGYCDHARRLFPGLDTSRCVERSYISDKEPPLGKRAVRALCSEPSIELTPKLAVFAMAYLYPALGSVSERAVLEEAIKFGLRESCDYALRALGDALW